MADHNDAGRLIEKVAFDKREQVDDGFGNIVAGDWQEQFQTHAAFTQLRASETVMAGRLESRNAILMQVRINDQTEMIGTDWQARDVRRGESYNVREKHPDAARAYFELLAESNVATG